MSTTTTKHMDAKKLYWTIQGPLEAVLPLLVAIGAGSHTTPSVGFQAWTGNQKDDPMLTESGRQLAAVAAVRLEEAAESLFELDMDLVTPKHGEAIRSLLFDAHYLFHLLAAALRGLEGTGSDALVTWAVMRKAKAFAKRVAAADPTGTVEGAVSKLDTSEGETGTVVPEAAPRSSLKLTLDQRRELVDVLVELAKLEGRAERTLPRILGWHEAHRYVVNPLSDAQTTLTTLLEKLTDPEAA